MMIQDKPTEQCTGLEMYVKEQIKTHETDFFPSGDALALNERRSVVINYWFAISFLNYSLYTTHLTEDIPST